MAITSAGYYGTVNDAQWAGLFEPLARWFRQGAFVPTAVASQRTVTLTAGVAFAAGIRDVSSAAATVALTPPSSGGQWWLISLRRTWSIGASGTTAITALVGGTTDGTVPTSWPTILPSGFVSTPGDRVDAPVAWVHVRAADTTLTIFDCRMVLDSNGRSVAASTAALTMLALSSPVVTGLEVVNLGEGATYRWNGTAWKLWHWTAIPFNSYATYGTGVTSETGGYALEASISAGELTLNYSLTASSIAAFASILTMLPGLCPAAITSHTATALATVSGVALMELNTSGGLYARAYIGTSGSITSLRGTAQYRIAG
jgi:hypothetical protein